MSDCGCDSGGGGDCGGGDFGGGDCGGGDTSFGGGDTNCGNDSDSHCVGIDNDDTTHTTFDSITHHGSSLFTGHPYSGFESLAYDNNVPSSYGNTRNRKDDSSDDQCDFCCLAMSIFAMMIFIFGAIFLLFHFNR